MWSCLEPPEFRQALDKETGLLDFGHRWYDAAVGQLLSEDPFGYFAGDMNLYRYVFNDPFNNTDPSGLCSKSVNNWWSSSISTISQPSWYQADPSTYSVVLRQPTPAVDYSQAFNLSENQLRQSQLSALYGGSYTPPVVNNGACISMVGTSWGRTGVVVFGEQSPSGSVEMVEMKGRPWSPPNEEIMSYQKMEANGYRASFGESWVSPWAPEADWGMGSVRAYGRAAGRTLVNMGTGLIFGGVGGGLTGGGTGLVLGSPFGPGAVATATVGAAAGGTAGGAFGLFTGFLNSANMMPGDSLWETTKSTAGWSLVGGLVSGPLPVIGAKLKLNVGTTDYGATQEGRPFTKHYGTETGPTRNIPGSVIDNTIKTTKGIAVEGGKTVHYDPVNDVTVVTGKEGSIVSARRGRPSKGK